jgi:hypothetical protein
LQFGDLLGDELASQWFTVHELQWPRAHPEHDIVTFELLASLDKAAKPNVGKWA